MNIHILSRSDSTRGEPVNYRPIKAFHSRDQAEAWLRDLSTQVTDFYAKKAYAQAKFTPDGYWHWSDDGVQKQFRCTEIELR